MGTIGEFVGGACDGLQIDPSDPNEPDDWPDQITATDNATGATETYYIRSHRATIRPGGVRVYYFDSDDMIDAREENSSA